VLDGGELLIEWLADNHVRMTGAWAESFRGEIEIGDLERAVA
jgi:diaminopimelate epimerase